MKKKLLIIDVGPTSLGYKLYYILKDYLDITLVSLSNSKKYDEKIYKDLGIEVQSFNLMGQRYWKDKKIFSGAKETLKFFLEIFKLKRRNYDFVLVRGGDLGGKIIFNIFKKPKKIYFPYDIHFLLWGLKLGERTKRNIEHERYCFEHADFIIHKGPEDELNLIKKTEAGKIPGKPIQFLPYCFDKWTVPIKKKKNKLKGIHLVYIGSFFPKDCTMLRISPIDLFELLAKQGIHMHIYTDNPVPHSQEKHLYPHKEIPNLKLNRVMSKYHYGTLLHFHNMGAIDERFLKTTIGNKFISYLEAGIPIIMNDEIEYMVSFIKKYNCGVVVSEKDLPNFKKILEKQDYPKLLEGVKKARGYFGIENQKKSVLKGLDLAF